MNHAARPENPGSTEGTTEGDRYRGSTARFEEACNVLAGGVNSNFRLGESPVPIFFARAHGAHLFDVDGNRYIDFAMGMGPAILGHAPSEVIRAVERSLADGQLYAGQHEAEVSLGRQLSEVVPCAERVRFGLSGSEMVQVAVRLARAATGRTIIGKFEGHYHGWMDSVYVSVTPGPRVRGRRRRPRSVPQSLGQSRAAARDTIVLPWNDITALETTLERYGERMAALLMEPVLCNTCVIPPHPAFLRRVREVTHRMGVLLVFDEVITGFRLALGGAQELLGVKPDVAVLAKALGGGFPIAAIAGRADVLELLGPAGGVVHGGTYNTGIPSVAAALATLGVLRRDGGAALRHISAIGESLMAGLREAAAQVGLPLVVQGYGSVFNTHFSRRGPATDYRSYCLSDAGMQSRFLQALHRAGIRPTRRGTWFPSLAHTEQDVADTLRAARTALEAVRSGR